MTHPLLRAVQPALPAPAIRPDRAAPALLAAQALPATDVPRWLELSELERTAMIRDGLSAPLLGQVCSPRLLPVTRAERARAVRAVVPAAVLAHAVLHRTAAAWFLSCSPAPDRLELMVHRARRTTMRPVDPDAQQVPWSVRQLVHEPQDVDRIHGILVTTPLRTAADLACWDGRGSAEALRRLLWAPHLGVEPVAVVDLLRERTRLPDRRRGVMAVRRAARELGLEVPR